MVQSKNDHFSYFLFLGDISQENVFYDILERKNALIGYKNKKFKEANRKIHIFPNGLTHGFGPKMANLAPFFLKQYSPRKILLQYSATKKTPF